MRHGQGLGRHGCGLCREFHLGSGAVEVLVDGSVLVDWLRGDG